METITIIVATRNRYNKLERMLGSVPDLDYINVVVVCDADPVTYSRLATFDLLKGKLTTKLVEEHVGSVACKNIAVSYVSDGLLYATDDIVFLEDSIHCAFELFNNTFPDDDGVVGFQQCTPGFSPTGVALLGKSFIDRYPNKKVFYPEYFHFCSQEIHRLCERIQADTGKVVFSSAEMAKVRHFHPRRIKSELDETHREARMHRSTDLNISRSRQREGIVWGRI